MDQPVIQVPAAQWDACTPEEQTLLRRVASLAAQEYMHKVLARNARVEREAIERGWPAR